MVLNNLEIALEVPLRRFFVFERRKKLVFDGKPGRSEFFSDSITYGLEKGLTYSAKTTEKRHRQTIEYKLSEKGKKHFGINN